jgi:hypothetical protein
VAAPLCLNNERLDDLASVDRRPFQFDGKIESVHVELAARWQWRSLFSGMKGRAVVARLRSASVRWATAAMSTDAPRRKDCLRRQAFENAGALRPVINLETAEALWLQHPENAVGDRRRADQMAIRLVGLSFAR